MNMCKALYVYIFLWVGLLCAADPFSPNPFATEVAQDVEVSEDPAEEPAEDTAGGAS